jgi:hypothetical protein
MLRRLLIAGRYRRAIIVRCCPGLSGRHWVDAGAAQGTADETDAAGGSMSFSRRLTDMPGAGRRQR